MTFERHLEAPWWALRIAFGAVPFLAGLDKYFNLLTNWEMYLNPLAPRLLHLGPVQFMHIVGIVEMVVGVVMMTRWTRGAAYVAAAWLVCIALNLISTGRYFDVAVRDLVMAVSAYSLARMTEVRETAQVRVPQEHTEPITRTRAA